ncbi:hypothetical protein BDP27DRAFT_198603 [Rhodocollybia butyracea]|uniref:Uncharacterized protein n=1 Tax=Rhodocollybia butyracea TaxID=206335 RepID=A0A9P5TUD9_9AGAR|nr:hypothetical protein BDP27DRAFT_198603 [Rhodocollybia butyracea]
MSTCVPHHDWFTAVLTFGLCYSHPWLMRTALQNHSQSVFRRSEPSFPSLGSHKCFLGNANLFTMQWGIIRCCRFLSFGSCIEMTAGVIQCLYNGQCLR